MEAARHPWPALGVLLLRDGLITEDQLSEIVESQRDARHQRIGGGQLGEILAEQGLVSPTQIARLLAEQYELPFMELNSSDVDPRAARAFTIGQAERFCALPINRRPDGSYDVAIADPSTVVFSDELRAILGSTVHFVVVGSNAVAEAIAETYSQPDVVVAGDLHEEEPSAALEHSDSVHDLFPARGALPQLWPPLGALLVRDGLIADDELESALAQQRLSTSQRLGEILVERGAVSSAAVARLVAEQYELPFAELHTLEIDPETVRLLPEHIARRYRAVPIARHDDGSVHVAIADPTSVFYSDDLHVELDAPLKLVVAPPDEIDELVAQIYDPSGGVQDDGAPAVDFDTHTVSAPDLDFSPVSDERAPVAALLAEPAADLAEAVDRALAASASALHLSHRDDQVQVQARVGTELEWLGVYPADALPNVLAALTDRADMELHALPTAAGMKITVASVERPAAPAALAELGLTAEAEHTLRTALSVPGLVVVTGRPGSGVTTTLYASLGVLATRDRVVATVEERVVRALDGVDQVEVDPSAGLSHATLLRQLWEMDADVVLVSQLPDTETATTALRCALAGRHILVGMRDIDAPSATAHVLELADDRERTAAALGCVVAQRLVSCICGECRETYYASPAELAALGLGGDERRLLARGRGCRRCGGTGSYGRTGVFEIVPMADELRDLVRHGAVAEELREAMAASGGATLRDELIRLCLDGVTTTAELDPVSDLR